MSKKIALVTGANKGIGFETAKQLAEQGIFVILGARDKEKGEKAVAKLTSLGLEVEYLALDMTDMNSIEGARDYISSKYGVLDILVNNAGVMTNDNGKDFLDVKITDIKIAFETNFFGVISLTQALLPLLKKSASAGLVTLSSVCAS